MMFFLIYGAIVLTLHYKFLVELKSKNHLTKVDGFLISNKTSFTVF